MVDQSSPDGLRELALFAGAGGGILGGKLLGWRTVCAVEWEPYPASVLAARQNDGLLPPFPIWDDIQTFDGRPWRGIVDVVSGGFPCQDISVAGKGDGLDGERSGMWKHMARVVGEVRPRFVFVENSPMLTSRGGTRVIADLAALGYDSRWTVMGASDVGAPHQRDRIWIVAHTRYWGRRDFGTVEAGQDAPSQWSVDPNAISGSSCQSAIVADTTSLRQQAPSDCEQHCQANSNRQTSEFGSSSEVLAHADCSQCKRGGISCGTHEEYTNTVCSSGWEFEPDVGRVAHGVAARVDRLKAIGNGQVPLCAAEAWRELSKDWT